MAHEIEVLEHLGNWNNKRFRPQEITFTEAAQSLASDDPLVVAKSGNNTSRWIMVNVKTEKVAILVFTGIWKWGTDLETGNFVPPGKHAPEGIPSDRIQTKPSYKCEVTYAFDTSIDGSIWEHLKEFEDHVCSHEEFNRGSRPRRKWQDGSDPDNRDTYIMTSKIFTRRTPFNSKSNGVVSPPYKVHPWVESAATEAKLIPNPERPLYYEYTEGVIRKLEDSPNPRFNRNDIIIVSCRVGFNVNGENWWPEIVPLQLIRVDQLPEAMTNDTNVSIYPAIDDDYTPLITGEPLQVFDEPSQTLKRKERDTDEPDQTAKRQELDLSVTPAPTDSHTPVTDEVYKEPSIAETPSRSKRRSKPVKGSRAIRD